MNNLPICAVLTANILGSFNDPFEFQGSYGEEIDPIRENVFDLVVPHEAVVRNLSDAEIRTLMPDPNASADQVAVFRGDLLEQAIAHDAICGPRLSELISEDLELRLNEKQRALEEAGFRPEDVTCFLKFIDKYVDQRVFQFMRDAPKGLLSLDKSLRDQASHHGKDLELSILSSSYPLKGRDIRELQANLLDQLITKETLELAKPEKDLKNSIAKIDPHYLQKFFGQHANNSDLERFCTPAGQVLFYWLYQSLNLHLVAQDSEMIDQINRVKQLFVSTLGNPQARARLFQEKVEELNFGVVFTQECGAATKDALEERFWPVERQNGRDGCFIFLRKDLWEPDYEDLSLDGYSGFVKGKVNLVLAKSTLTGELFLLSSCHGESTNAADGRLQITLVMEKFRQEAKKVPGLQLMIGIDANTKSEEEVSLLHALLDQLGLVGTNVGPTTIKKRMVTVQHNKAAKAAIDEEDFLIVLKPETGGRYTLTCPTVGFKEQKPDLNQALPNLDNPSDHYPIGAHLELVDFGG